MLLDRHLLWHEDGVAGEGVSGVREEGAQRPLPGAPPGPVPAIGEQGSPPLAMPENGREKGFETGEDTCNFCQVPDLSLEPSRAQWLVRGGKDGGGSAMRLPAARRVQC